MVLLGGCKATSEKVSTTEQEAMMSLSKACVLASPLSWMAAILSMVWHPRASTTRGGTPGSHTRAH